MAFTRNGQSAASTRTTTRAAQTAPQFETAGSAAMTPATPTKPVEIEAADGQHFAVSFEDVRHFISPKATDAECKIFLETCRAYHLNPFTKEAFLIHYDNKSDETPATIVLGKSCYMQMAERHPAFDGFEAGVIVLSDGQIEAREGSIVLPYMYPDLNVARDLASAGAAAIMPLGAPIGSNKGLATRDFIQILIDEIDLPIIVDAGIGRPSQACEAMEMGAAAIMANTALATAGDLPMMASAFRKAIEAGRQAYLSGLGRVLTRGGSASDPLTGFLHD